VQNFEWSKEYAIRTPIFVFPLALLALPARALSLRKLEVLFVMRFTFGVIATGALQVSSFRGGNSCFLQKSCWFVIRVHFATGACQYLFFPHRK